MRPDVSRSRRWTIPGRSSAPPSAPSSSRPCASGLVDDQELLVFPDDRDVHGLGLDPGFRRQLDLDGFSTLQPVALRPAGAVHLDESVGEQPLRLGARGDLRPGREDAVERF